MTDLFGQPDPPARSPRHRPARGHAAPPGTGPEGETCGTCTHLVRTGRSRRCYPKCGLIRAAWTHGPKTDIRIRDKACRKWERAESPP